MSEHIACGVLGVEHLIGRSLSAARGGEEVQIQTSEFVSTEDGGVFVETCEVLVGAVLKAMPFELQVRPNQIDNLIAVFPEFGRADVYINAAIIERESVRPKHHIKPNSLVFQDMILDVVDVDLHVLNNRNFVAADAGILHLFSHGWRRGLYYDFSPISRSDTSRQLPYSRVFAAHYSALRFSSLHGMSDEQWNLLDSHEWFPFRALKLQTTRDVIGHLESGWDLEDLFPRITAEVASCMQAFINEADRHSDFAQSRPHLVRGWKAFQENDWSTCCTNFYLQIESILRSVVHRSGSMRFKQRDLLEAVDPIDDLMALSSTLPRKFRVYLEKHFFFPFEDQVTNWKVGRNTLAHGLIPATALTQKAALRGVLTVLQLYYSLPRP